MERWRRRDGGRHQRRWRTQRRRSTLDGRKVAGGGIISPAINLRGPPLRSI
ncbi:hypothetical protein LINPERPRIM_LOCUS36792 [Linum perenne]